MSSKVSKDALYEAVDNILKDSKGDRKRNFTESIELQVCIQFKRNFSNALPRLKKFG